MDLNLGSDRLTAANITMGGGTGLVSASTGTFSVSSPTFPLYISGGSLMLGYNATNLRILSSQLNTIQDIATTSSPTFAALTLGGALTFNSTTRSITTATASSTALTIGPGSGPPAGTAPGPNLILNGGAGAGGGNRNGGDVVITGGTPAGSGVRGSVKMGNNVSTDFTEIEPDGTIHLNGAATAHDDIQFKIDPERLGVANVPQLATITNNLQEYVWEVNDYAEYFTEEVIHKYKEGADLYFHVHGFTNGLDNTDRAIKFELEYSIQADAYSAVTGIGSVLPASTTISTEFTIPANTPDKSGFFFSFPAVSGAGLKIGSQVKTRLKRVTATGTAPTNNPFIGQLGCHVEMDTIGSRTISTK